MAGSSAAISPASPLSKWIKYQFARFSNDRDAKIDRQDNRMMGRIMSRLLRSDSNCVEIGADTGAQLKQILRHASAGTHFAFEPQPEFARSLAAAFPSVRVREIALSDHEGETEFSQCLTTPGWSGFKKWNTSTNQETKSIRVQMRTLDQVLPVDYVVRLIKIDVEGAELQVLRGAVATIRRSRPHILFEHGCGAADAYGTTPEMIFDFFAAEAYVISSMPKWLHAGKPFTREQFGNTFRRHEAWNFIAYPAAAKPVLALSPLQKLLNALRGEAEVDTDAETALVD